MPFDEHDLTNEDGESRYLQAARLARSAACLPGIALSFFTLEQSWAPIVWAVSAVICAMITVFVIRKPARTPFSIVVTFLMTTGSLLTALLWLLDLVRLPHTLITAIILLPFMIASGVELESYSRRLPASFRVAGVYVICAAVAWFMATAMYWPIHALGMYAVVTATVIAAPFASRIAARYDLIRQLR